MAPTSLLQAAVNGVLVGSLYSVMAIGLTIIFGVMRVINMAYGVLIMRGMYIAYWLFSLYGAGQPIALIVSLPIFLAAGAMIYAGVVGRAERRAGEMGTLLATAGLSYVLANTAQLAWKADFRSLPSALSGASFSAAGIAINSSLLSAFVAFGILAAATSAFPVCT